MTGRMGMGLNDPGAEFFYFHDISIARKSSVHLRVFCLLAEEKAFSSRCMHVSLFFQTAYRR